jgi:cytochrome d ubiquinol oxidase subunit I
MLAGWYTTEIGRQPWLIQGVMRTADGVSAHTGSELGFTLATFVIVYVVVFGAGTVYALRLIRKGPQVREGELPTPGGAGRPRQPMRPLSGAYDDTDAAQPGYRTGSR